MRKFAGVFCAAAIFGATAVFADGEHDHDKQHAKQIKARQGVMWAVALNLGKLGAMAKGEMAYDADTAAAAAKSLNGLSMLHIKTLFPAGSDSGMDDSTDAKAEIWGNWDLFEEKWAAFGTAAQSAASEAGDGQDALRPLMGAFGKSCKGCHDDFRVPQE